MLTHAHRLSGGSGPVLGVIALVAVLLSGCGTPDADVTGAGGRPGSLCDASFADAAIAPATGSNLDVAIRRCANLIEWRTRAEVHPQLLGGRDAIEFLQERCSDPTADLSGYAGCGTLVIALATPSPTPRKTRAPKRTPRPTPVVTPRPTPRPTPVPLPRIPSITGSYFGPGVKVSWYRITGSTAMELYDSMAAHGPVSAWLGGRAQAVTKPTIRYRFTRWPDAYGGCTIVKDASPAIKTTFTIVLPLWKPPRTTDHLTVRWWVDELLSTARHERVHVRILVAATREANKMLASSTCSNEASRLEAVWRDAQRKNCEFDLDEYGRAQGLTLRSCMAH